MTSKPIFSETEGGNSESSMERKNYGVLFSKQLSGWMTITTRSASKSNLQIPQTGEFFYIKF